MDMEKFSAGKTEFPKLNLQDVEGIPEYADALKKYIEGLQAQERALRDSGQPYNQLLLDIYSQDITIDDAVLYAKANLGTVGISVLEQYEVEAMTSSQKHFYQYIKSIVADAEESRIKGNA